MLRKDTRPHRRIRNLFAVGLSLAAAAVWASPSTGLVPPLAFHNTGDSMPKGFYVLEPGEGVKRGSIVVVRDPKGFKLWWLMKRVAGVAGDSFCWDETAGTHRLNGRPMPKPAPEAVAMGVPVWKGCRALRPGELVGYGESWTSYDSRYFGPLTTASLFGVYRPL